MQKVNRSYKNTERLKRGLLCKGMILYKKGLVVFPKQTIRKKWHSTGASKKAAANFAKSTGDLFGKDTNTFSDFFFKIF